ncbi:hypothetical protein ACFVVU_30625 [Kitasatospora sp. NPDC057965]|uniref:hypothetical protein n=1 Tax=Kitasatospora sp. NPDC057965 TaxID=3346291 RepID=UPI0036DDB884
MLADYGFTPIPGRDGDLVFTGTTDSLVLHARQTVAALRSTGAVVQPDREFEYDTHPGYPSPSSMAAAPGARIVTGPVAPAAEPVILAGPAAASRADVTIGTHPERGITATNTTSTPAAARLLAQAGFYRVPGHRDLFSLTEQQAAGVERATHTVGRLRAAGLSVAADALYDPDQARADDDPFRTRLFRVDEQPAPEHSHAGPDDPFLTKVVRAARSQNSGEPAPMTTPAVAPVDPFNTQRPTAGPADRSAADPRMGALVSNRQRTLAAIEEILDGLAQQLRDDPQSLDPAQVSAVLAEAHTVLGGVRQDLEQISATTAPRTRAATHAPRPAATAALGARAQAARATSLRLGRVSAAQPVEAATRPVDPRLEYSIHSR